MHPRKILGMNVRELTIRQARAECLEFGQWYVRRHEIIIEAHLAGMQIRQIADLMEVSRQTVSDTIRRYMTAPQSSRPGSALSPPRARAGTYHRPARE